MLVETGKAFVDPFAMMTQMREDSDFCLPPLTILCWRTHLVITKHHKDMDLAWPKWTTPQPDWLRSSEKAFPIRSEHCQITTFSRSRQVFTTCWWWPSAFAWKKFSEPKHTRLKFDLEKLKDPNVLKTFEAMIGRRFAPLTIMDNEDHLDSMITTFNTAVIETASEILGKHRQRKKKQPWSLQKFLICATKGEKWEWKDSNLKDLRNKGSEQQHREVHEKGKKKLDRRTVYWDWRKSEEEQQ